MNIKFFLQTILSILVVILAGCTSEESSENLKLEGVAFSFVLEAIDNASENEFQQDNLPDWLHDFVLNLKQDDIQDVVAFQTKWKGEVIYFVYDTYSSCLLCNTFKSNGEKFGSSNNEFFEFWNSAPYWELIYLSKSKIHDL